MSFFKKNLNLNKMLLVKKKLYLPSTLSTLTPSRCDNGHCYCTSVEFLMLSFLRIRSSQTPSHSVIQKRQLMTCSDIRQ